MERYYKIGDVSGKLGISRDALRFYEKKGIIRPQKQDNGYRCYSYQDVRILYDILFFRNYDFGLEDIFDLLNNCTYDSFVGKLQNKIKEETLLLEQKKRSLNNLIVNQAIISQAVAHLNIYEKQPFPDFYLIEEDILSAHQQALELCYMYDAYTIVEQNITMTGQYMLVPAHAASGLEDSIPLPPENRIRHQDCIYTVVESDSYSPRPGQLSAAVAWAQQQDLHLAGAIYAGHLIHCVKEDRQVYYIGMYLPLS